MISDLGFVIGFIKKRLGLRYAPTSNTSSCLCVFVAMHQLCKTKPIASCQPEILSTKSEILNKKA